MKRLFAFALAAICSGGILAADGLSETDENGLTPYVWWKFDGSNTEYGSYATEATIAGTYVISQGGFALKHTGNGWGGGIGTANNWDDWTLVVVAKATSVDNGVIFGLGNRNSNTPACINLGGKPSKFICCSDNIERLAINLFHILGF